MSEFLQTSIAMKKFDEIRKDYKEDFSKFKEDVSHVNSRVDELQKDNQTNRELLIRIDERTEELRKSLTEYALKQVNDTTMHATKDEINVIKVARDKQIADLQIELVEVKRTLRAEFEKSLDPVKRLVYGAVGLILIAVVGAIIATVLR